MEGNEKIARQVKPVMEDLVDFYQKILNDPQFRSLNCELLYKSIMRLQLLKDEKDQYIMFKSMSTTDQ